MPSGQKHRGGPKAALADAAPKHTELWPEPEGQGARGAWAVAQTLGEVADSPSASEQVPDEEQGIH